MVTQSTKASDCDPTATTGRGKIACPEFWEGTEEHPHNAYFRTLSWTMSTGPNEAASGGGGGGGDRAVVAKFFPDVLMYWAFVYAVALAAAAAAVFPSLRRTLHSSLPIRVVPQRLGGGVATATVGEALVPVVCVFSHI